VVTIEGPLPWGDQDAPGHVNHVRYFRWYETPRIVYAEKVGLMRLRRERNIGPILASVVDLTGCGPRRSAGCPFP